jgi:hypothetical protein
VYLGCAFCTFIDFLVFCYHLKNNFHCLTDTEFFTVGMAPMVLVLAGEGAVSRVFHGVRVCWEGV